MRYSSQLEVVTKSLPFPWWTEGGSRGTLLIEEINLREIQVGISRG